MGTGLLLPEESGSPSLIRMHRMPLTFPSVVSTSTGATRYWISTPSASAASISSSLAGISSRERR